MRDAWTKGPEDGEGTMDFSRHLYQKCSPPDEASKTESGQNGKGGEGSGRESLAYREARAEAKQKRKDLEAAPIEEKVEEDCMTPEERAEKNGQNLETKGGLGEAQQPAMGGGASGALRGGGASCSRAPLSLHGHTCPRPPLGSCLREVRPHKAPTDVC